MKLFKSVLAIALALLMQPVFAEKVVVIVNASNDQAVSTVDVKNIYEDNLTTWANGNKVNAYHLPTKTTARETFSRNVLGTSAKASAMELANKKITNTAKNPPTTRKDILVVSFISKNMNAIGYVPASAIEGKSGVKVLFSLGE